jgi:hypothetical protein
MGGSLSTPGILAERLRHRDFYVLDLRIETDATQPPRA